MPTGEWSGTLGKAGGAGEIPCRRMRSGSYVKAMGDVEDSDDSDGPPSPKPSPKTAARRQSYLKATQQSLSEQQPPLPPRKWVEHMNHSMQPFYSYRHLQINKDTLNVILCVETAGHNTLLNISMMPSGVYSLWPADGSMLTGWLVALKLHIRSSNNLYTH